jgi:serine/threonine-protein kinase
MAPEQAAGEPVDARADVYAAGVLAYEMLTGTLPIVAETPTGTILAQRTRVPEPPSLRRPELPRAVDELVLRALAKRREDRHRSMEALAIAAARVRGAAAERQARPRRRSGNARGAALAAVAMVAASAAAGWWWRTATPAPTATSTPTRSVLAAKPRSSLGAPWGAATATTTSTRSVLAAKPRSSLGAPWGASTSTRQDVRRRAAARTDPRDAHLEDPYAAGGLKPDPFE